MLEKSSHNCCQCKAVTKKNYTIHKSQKCLVQGCVNDMSTTLQALLISILLCLQVLSVGRVLLVEQHREKIAACSSNRCILDKMNMHCIWFGQCAKKNTCENLIPPFRFRPVQATPRALPRRRRQWSWTEVCLETCRGMLDPWAQTQKDLETHPMIVLSSSSMGMAANSGVLKAGTDVCTCVGYWFVVFCAHLLMSSSRRSNWKEVASRDEEMWSTNI